MIDFTPFSRLPFKKDISTIQIGSLVAAVLMSFMSLLGLVFTQKIYPTAELVHTYLPNDLINLFIGLPGLLGSIWLARRGRLIGLLFWPGALMYVIYNYIAMLVGVPFGWTTLVYAALVLLSAYLLFDLLRKIDRKAVQTRLAGAVFERVSGGTLAFFGVGFFFLAVGAVSEATASQTIIMPDVGVAVADMVLSIMLLAGGILFFLRRPFGYASGPGMLFAAMTLFIGVILFVVIQPLLTKVAISLEDLIVLSVMGLLCAIPFGLLTRGVISTEK